MADRREFVQLAKKVEIGKTKMAGNYWSRKLDGMRALWDGGISRGIPVDQIPWANFQRDTKIRLATGLWSRLGKPVTASEEWLDQLPPRPLDGELYLGFGALEETMACREHEPDPAVWAGVRYLVFDTPSAAFLEDGEIVYDSKTRKVVTFGQWGFEKYRDNFVSMTTPFPDRLAVLQNIFGVKSGEVKGTQIELVEYDQLPNNEFLASQKFFQAFQEYVDVGGEGLMLRMKNDLWLPHRRGNLLKYKPTVEDTAKVLGYFAGEIGVQGTLHGRLGSIQLEWNGKQFTAGGFTFEERGLSSEWMTWALANPGKRFPETCNLPRFPIGSEFPFKYTSLTAAGVPREARYDRPNS